MHQNQESVSDISKEEFDKFVKEEEEKGNVISKPKVVQDGKCKHYYVYEGIDADGYGNAACRDCWSGKAFKLDEMEVVDGEIRSIS